MRMLRVIVPLAVALVVGCWKPHPPDDPPPGPPPEPEAAGGGSSFTCETVCARARELRCSWVKPTAEGHTCEDVCTNIQESNITSWNLRCRTRATTCAVMDECEAGK